MRFCTRLHRLVVGAALCSLVGISACQANNLGLDVDGGVLRRGHAIFQDQTCVRTDTYAIVETDGPMELCVRIGLKSGALAWQIQGPDGQKARDSADVTRDGPYHVAHCTEVTPGDWQVVLDMRQASGEYEIAWYEPGSAPDIVTRLP